LYGIRVDVDILFQFRVIDCWLHVGPFKGLQPALCIALQRLVLIRNGLRTGLIVLTDLLAYIRFGLTCKVYRDLFGMGFWSIAQLSAPNPILVLIDSAGILFPAFKFL